ncbi:MAG: NGG1p interacting factor NIF3, partial [Gammaproteobacteria bacterium]|nr:NGG1p interacting factor NIF3 [Gammaproteobacteria bacterium]MBU2317460.1 NGG1p interacting factor NIF3 [Gammaproteobacteria bacterium]
CCWQVKGQGQFKPVKGATPFLGKVDELEFVDEYRVEMVLSEEVKAVVLAALLLAHPYEEVAYHFIQIQC